MIDIYDETIDQRNSMRDYRYHTLEEAFSPISEYEMKMACKERDKLQKRHAVEHVDVWMCVN